MPTTGRYEHIDGSPVVRFERTFPHAVEAVWDAVTDPRRLEQWFPTTVEFGALATGAPITFRFAQGGYPPMSGVIVVVEPQRRLIFTWGDDELTFELEPRDGGSACRLRFSVVLDSADKAARDSVGWEGCLDGLGDVVAGRAPERPAPDGRWKAHYEEYRRMGLPATAPIPD
jgi:uncharacterized protein YndB with AHSA1/START domain